LLIILVYVNPDLTSFLNGEANSWLWVTKWIFWKSSFIQDKIINKTSSKIDIPKDVCCPFYELYCWIINCQEQTFLMCPRCKKNTSALITWSKIFISICSKSIAFRWNKVKSTDDDEVLFVIVGFSPNSLSVNWWFYTKMDVNSSHIIMFTYQK